MAKKLPQRIIHVEGQTVRELKRLLGPVLAKDANLRRVDRARCSCRRAHPGQELVKVLNVRVVRVRLELHQNGVHGQVANRQLDHLQCTRLRRGAVHHERLETKVNAAGRHPKLHGFAIAIRLNRHGVQLHCRNGIILRRKRGRGLHDFDDRRQFELEHHLVIHLVDWERSLFEQVHINRHHVDLRGQGRGLASGQGLCTPDLADLGFDPGRREPFRLGRQHLVGVALILNGVVRRQDTNVLEDAPNVVAHPLRDTTSWTSARDRHLELDIPQVKQELRKLELNAVIGPRRDKGNVTLQGRETTIILLNRNIRRLRLGKHELLGKHLRMRQLRGRLHIELGCRIGRGSHSFRALVLNAS